MMTLPGGACRGGGQAVCLVIMVGAVAGCVHHPRPATEADGTFRVSSVGFLRGAHGNSSQGFSMVDGCWSFELDVPVQTSAMTISLEPRVGLDRVAGGKIDLIS